MKPDLPALDYATFGSEFETLQQVTINKLEREWPQKWERVPGANVVLESIMRVTRNTYQSIRFLAADTPENPARKLEYSLSVTPLARTLADTLFNLVFLFQDLPERSRWYYKSGWREVTEEYNRHVAVYGGDPEWKEWLNEFAQGIAQMEKTYEVTDEERNDPRRIPWWPHPGKMLRHQVLSEDRRAFLQYVNDWFYRSLSSHSHLSLPGLFMRSAALLPGTDKGEDDWRLEKQRSDAVVVSTVLTLAIMSEIELECHFGFGVRLSYVWGILNGYFGLAKALHAQRYEGILQ
jgi:hypothetical protein